METTAQGAQLPGMHELRRLIRDVPDFPKQGVLFKDITPLLADPAGLALAVEFMVQPFRAIRIDKPGRHEILCQYKPFILF